MTISEGRVIVTGATRGIGRATVDAILPPGRPCRRHRPQRGCASRARGDPPDRIRALPAELADVEGLPALAERAVDAFGGVDGLVNCAGIAQYEAVGSIGSRVRRGSAAGQPGGATAPLPGSRAHIRGQGGSIVNVSSTLSERRCPTHRVYAATKAALNALTQGSRSRACARAAFG